MKKLLSLLLMTTAITLFMSCSDDNPSPEPTTPQFAEVKLNCGGEFSVTEQPWTRATGGKTFYAFRIDSMHVEERYEPHMQVYYDTTYVSYAEGLFDASQDFSVKLQLGHKYKIHSLIVHEETDHLVNNGMAYNLPFTTSSDQWVNCTNSFTYTKSSNMNLDNCDGIASSGNKWIFMPSLEKYYGFKDIDCSCDLPNEITIPMLRYSFMIEMNITPPSVGQLNVHIPDGVSIEPYVVKSTDSKFTDTKIFVMPHVTYANRDEVKRLSIDVKWDKPNGSPYAHSYSINICRNHKYKVNIDFTNYDANTKIDFSQEDITYEDGGTININHYHE